MPVQTSFPIGCMGLVYFPTFVNVGKYTSPKDAMGTKNIYIYIYNIHLYTYIYIFVFMHRKKLLFEVTPSNEVVDKPLIFWCRVRVTGFLVHVDLCVSIPWSD